MKKLLTLFLSLLVGFSSWLDGFNMNVGHAGNFNPIMTTPVTMESLHSVNKPAVVDAFAVIFGRNVNHLSQQKGSQLMPFVQMMGMTQAAQQVIRMGVLPDPTPLVSRGSRVTASNPVTDVRWVEARRFWQACHVASWDQLRTLFEIQAAYTQAMSMSFGRLKDRVIIAAALGVANTGPSRSVDVGLPQSQRYVAGRGSTGDIEGSLSFKDLISIRTKAKEDFVIDSNGVLVMAVTANEVYSLLEQTQITSRDFTNTLVLASGKIQAFLGILFVETQLLSTLVNPTLTYGGDRFASGSGTSLAAGTYQRCFAFVAGHSLSFGQNLNIFSRVSERDDLHYDTQIYFATEFGAVRKEEVSVIEVLSKRRG